MCVRGIHFSSPSKFFDLILKMFRQHCIFCFLFNINFFKHFIFLSSYIENIYLLILFLDCLKTATPSFSSVLASNVACYISPTCNYMSCCIYIDMFRRSLLTSIDINTCHYTLVVELEHLHYELSLFNYDWGT